MKQKEIKKFLFQPSVPLISFSLSLPLACASLVGSNLGRVESFFVGWEEENWRNFFSAASNPGRASERVGEKGNKSGHKLLYFVSFSVCERAGVK